MITVTKSAAEHIRKSAESSQARGMFLRIAVRLGDGGAIEYGLGFDDKGAGDVHLTSEGVDILIADGAKELLMGAVLDYVEIKPGEHQFIFFNPNDPAHTKPAAGDAAG